jgi:aclacinomycin oxidase
MLKERFTERQACVAYDHLTSTGRDVMGGMLGLASHGGRVNTVAPDATASPQRSSIFDTACTTGWLDRRDEAKNLTWVREFYRDLFAETGGVPVPGDAYRTTTRACSRSRHWGEKTARQRPAQGGRVYTGHRPGSQMEIRI